MPSKILGSAREELMESLGRYSSDMNEIKNVHCKL